MKWRPALKPILLCLTFLSGIVMPVSAQITQDFLQQFIEIIAENQESGEEFDYTEIGEQLDDWRRSPVDINSPDAAVFVQWKIISENAYRALQDHIAKNGPLLNILELQSIPGFDPDVIHILQVIAKVAGREIQTQTLPLGEMLLHGQNEIYFRAGRTLQESDGYLGPDPAYEGNPDKLYFRYRHRNSNTLSYGITAEKDAGEAFFKGSNPQGFDFYSYHISLQQYKPWLPAVMLGDFNANFGQGLIMHSGFGSGKTSFVTSVKRTGNPLRGYSSVEENNFLRGAAVTLKPADHLTVTLLASSHKRDGNFYTDTIQEPGEVEEIESGITSLQTSNLHRTDSEIADEDIITLTQAGLSVSYTRNKTHLGLNALHSRLSAPLNRSPELYNQFYFNGDRLTNASVDYGFWFGGFHLFGETAMSDNGAVSTLNGLLAGLDRHINAVVMLRSYARDYQALSPNAFGESSLANNETGIYTGLEITPSDRWKIQLYQDVWKHPWLRYNIDGPTQGTEYYSRVTYTIKRRLEVYLQYRTKQNQINDRPDGDPIAQVVDQRRSQIRLHVNNILTKGIQLRTRLEWNTYSLPDETQHGFMVYQDVVYSPISSPWTISGRVTLFDTDGYDSRIYTYENDLIYYYAIPSFSDVGSRYYINVRYKGIRNLTAEIKFAQTRQLDALSIGSGYDEIPGNIRSEIRMQLIYRFDN